MKLFRKRNLINASIASAALLFGTSAFAATNQATYPGGGGVTLTDSNTVTVTAAALAIVKEMRDLSGNDLGASTTLASGTKFYFVLYVDNNTSLDLSNVRFIDDVDTTGTGFTVDTASFEILNSVAAPGIEMDAAADAAWAGNAAWLALTWAALDPAVGADQLDWNVTAANRVTVGSAGGNTQLDIVKSTGNITTEPRRAAVRFQVTVN